MSEIINAVVPIDAIHPHPRNYKMHPLAQIAQLKASHQRFKQYRSVVIWQRPDGAYLQVAGHGIVEAMKERGVKEVRADILPVETPEEDIEGILIADNQLPLGASENEELLAMLLQEQQDAGYDLASLGTDDESLRQMLESLGDEMLVGGSGFGGGEGGDDFDTAPEEGPTRAQLGDLWQLGGHRLLVADCAIVENVRRLMGSKTIDLVVTDPPYGVAYSGLGQNTQHQTIENDDLDLPALKSFLLSAFSAWDQCMKDGCAVYVCHADRPRGTRPVFEAAFSEVGWKFSATLIWVKNVAGMGWQDYRAQHEPILYGWKPGASHYFCDDRSQTTVWAIARDNAADYAHPTQKPIELASRAIRNSSRSGEIIADFFGGAGMTLIGAHREGRTAYLMELSPAYADVILARYEAETGQTAELLERVEVEAHA